jgi:hypothetical protein
MYLYSNGTFYYSTTLSITTISIITLGIKGLFVTLNINITQLKQPSA